VGVLLAESWPPNERDSGKEMRRTGHRPRVEPTGWIPSHQQAQVRSQLSSTLSGIVSQRLIPLINGGRVPAVEILVGSSAVSANIRDGKTHMIDSIIQTSQDTGMVTLEGSLSELVLSGAISLDVAKSFALHPDDLLQRVK